MISYIFLVKKVPSPILHSFGAMGTFNALKRPSVNHTPHTVCYVLYDPEQPLLLPLKGQ